MKSVDLSGLQQGWEATKSHLGSESWWAGQVAGAWSRGVGVCGLPACGWWDGKHEPTMLSRGRQKGKQALKPSTAGKGEGDWAIIWPLFTGPAF